MIPVKCESAPCKSSLATYRSTYYANSLADACPSCGLSGFLVPCAIIHHLVEDRYGPIQGQDGKRYNFGCESARRGYRSHWKDPRYPRHYTPIISAVSCTDCLLGLGARELNGELLVVR